VLLAGGCPLADNARMDRPREVHVVFGAGQIGAPLAERLIQAGHDVRVVRRSPGTPPAGATLRTGDAGDALFVADAVRGASAVYHCMNPPYSHTVWALELPRWRAAITAAAARENARVVILDNLYLLGRPNGQKLSETSPIAPCSRKGEIRAREWQAWLAAHHKGDVRVVCGRGSDFYGPGCTQSYFGDEFMPKALGSGIAQTLTRLDTPHTYHYTLDVVAGLSELGAAPDSETGRWWMLPAAPAVSTQGMLDLIGEAIGRKLRVRAIPTLAIKGLSLFMPILRELGEMGYQWSEPFVVDDRAFRTRFTTPATPLEQGVRAMMDWARQHYAASLQA
jgi:nucleoside-diphosphate-sugar epimerase